MDMALFAGVAVSDFDRGVEWFERLLGAPPTFKAHDTEVVWGLAEDRSIYVVLRPERAGYAMVTVFLDDLDGLVEAAAARGIHPEQRETYGNGVRKATYLDPDGNEIGFGGAPEEAGSANAGAEHPFSHRRTQSFRAVANRDAVRLDQPDVAVLRARYTEPSIVQQLVTRAAHEDEVGEVSIVTPLRSRSLEWPVGTISRRIGERFGDQLRSKPVAIRKASIKRITLKLRGSSCSIWGCSVPDSTDSFD